VYEHTRKLQKSWVFHGILLHSTGVSGYESYKLTSLPIVYSCDVGPPGGLRARSGAAYCIHLSKLIPALGPHPTVDGPSQRSGVESHHAPQKQNPLVPNSFGGMESPLPEPDDPAASPGRDSASRYAGHGVVSRSTPPAEP
jgi:hypothetical protein